MASGVTLTQNESTPTFLQDVWKPVYYDVFGGNEALLSIIGSYVVTVGTFWGINAVLLYIDVTGCPGWLACYKTQQDKNVPMDMDKLMKALRVVIFNMCGINALVAIPMYLTQKWAGIPFDVESVPGLCQIVRDLAVSTIVQEVIFYYSHRVLHHPVLYKNIHKQHHEWTAPIGIIAIYTHPVEYLTGNGLSILMGPVIMRSHLLTVWIWYILATLVTVIHHSGYHFPLLPSPQFHDYHHSKFNENFGTLGILDKLHGTDKNFRDSIEGDRDRIFIGITPINVTFPSRIKKQH